MANNATVRLSTQEIIDCDVNNLGCDGCFINKVMKWKRTNEIADFCASSDNE
jgi:hypothetical protein